MRAAVFDALAGFSQPASAYDIAEAVSSAEGRRVAANSVYRILDLFVGANLARRVESANAYVANAHPDCLHDCIFLICDTCGQTVHIDDDTLSGGVRQAAETAGFTAPRPVIEVRGTCGDCERGLATGGEGPPAGRTANLRFAPPAVLDAATEFSMTGRVGDFAPSRGRYEPCPCPTARKPRCSTPSPRPPTSARSTRRGCRNWPRNCARR